MQVSYLSGETVGGCKYSYLNTHANIQCNFQVYLLKTRSFRKKQKKKEKRKHNIFILLLFSPYCKESNREDTQCCRLLLKD